MRRAPDHVFQFMMTELGTEGSIDGKKILFFLIFNNILNIFFSFRKQAPCDSRKVPSEIHRVAAQEVYPGIRLLPHVSLLRENQPHQRQRL